MPAVRCKKTKSPESVPNEGDPDRKRVLNVLAQRRYRQRRRERIAALEAQADGTISISSGQRALHGDLQIEPERLGVILPEPRRGESSIVDEVARSPSMDCTSLLDFDHEPFELDFLQEYNFPNLPSPLPSTPASPPLQFPLTPDGAVLSIPILSALRAFASVAIAFDVVTHIWDPSYLHVLPPSIPAVATLPANLHPVPAQLSVPHHPMLDLLPWPSVREKLICMLSMPSTFRPPVAREDDEDEQPLYPPAAAATIRGKCSIGGVIKQSSAIVQLVQDLDDFQDGGGVRVHGNSTTWSEGNELMEDAWEIGDLFYRKWWWCLDQRIVEVSNRRRRERGLPRLKMIA